MLTYFFLSDKINLTLVNNANTNRMFKSYYQKSLQTQKKVANSGPSRLIAHPSIFRLFIKGNLTLILSLVTLRMCCGSYVNMIKNQKIIAQIVDVFT